MTLAGKHYLAALVWIALLGIVYVAIDSQIQPKVAIATGTVAEIVISRSRDGHFYVAGQINGAPVTFMVDTGATSVAIGEKAARRIGLPSGRPVSIGTAGGVTRGEEVVGQTIRIGGITVQGARVVVLQDLTGEALLGQNVLRHIEVSQSADRMILRARSAQ